MTRVANIQFDHAANNGIPALNGVGSTNALRTGVAEGATGYLPVGVGGRISGFTNLTLTGNGNRLAPVVQLLEGNFVQPTNPYFDLWLSGDPAAIGSTYSQGAMRAIIAAPAASGGVNGVFVAGMSTGTLRWRLDQYWGGGWGLAGLDYRAGNPAGGTFRVEVQWDTSQSQWIAARLYANDGTTLFNSLVSSSSGTPYGINVLRFGDVAGQGGGVSWYIGEIEAWDTRDGDGTFSNQWNSSAGGVFSTSNAGSRRSASYSIPVDFSTPSDSVSATYTTHSTQGYGNAGRVMDIYIPNGTPPNGGAWPVVMWAPSGYFVSGSRNTLVEHWRNRLLNAGYAVATLDYVKATLTNTTYQAYGTTDTPSGANTAYGRYPSFIVDYKLAAVRMRDKYAHDGTAPLENDLGYGIDATRMIASGYSAGGYLALGAALSRDLTNDGSSRDLTIAGNSSFRTMETGSAYTGTDPEFAGAFVYGAPISLKSVMDVDWTHNLTNAVLWPPVYTSGVPTTQAGAGSVHIAARAFMGTAVTASDPSGSTFTDTAITNLIAKQHAANPTHLDLPVHYVVGTADYLIPASEEVALAAATAGTAIAYSTSTSPAQHDKLDEVYDFDALESFLAAATAGSTWLPKVIMF